MKFDKKGTTDNEIFVKTPCDPVAAAVTQLTSADGDGDGVVAPDPTSHPRRPARPRSPPKSSAETKPVYLHSTVDNFAVKLQIGRPIGGR